MQTIRTDATATYRGRPVRVIAVDSDPRCDVWVVFTDTDPDVLGADEDAMVDPTELVDVRN